MGFGVVYNIVVTASGSQAVDLSSIPLSSQSTAFLLDAHHKRDGGKPESLLVVFLGKFVKVCRGNR